MTTTTRRRRAVNHAGPLIRAHVKATRTLDGVPETREAYMEGRDWEAMKAKILNTFRGYWITVRLEDRTEYL